jgi:hypothetical protein
MKAIFLFTLIISTSTVSSQSSVYHPFPTTNTTWTYQYYDDFHNPTGIISRYHITGDTLILGRTYKKISGGSIFENSGGIRDSNKVIYFIPDTSSTEYVLYDFNLNIGDTLSYPEFGGFGNYPAIVASDVDSVLASDGWHRRIFLNSADYWIEGVGADHYLFAPTGFMGLSGNDRFQCMTTDSGFIYQVGNCFTDVPEEFFTNDRISISPNPFHTSATIYTSIQFETAELKIYNSIGAMVRDEINRMEQSGFTINRGDLNEGFYFLQLICNNEQHTLKFIID